MKASCRIGNSGKIGIEDKVSVDDKLTILRDYVTHKSVSHREASEAIVALFVASYFLVHILTNKGENYDDSLQVERYKKSLTVVNLAIINSISGNYE